MAEGRRPLSGPFEPFRLAGLTLRNRVIKAATFEGMTRGASVSDALVQFHRDVARGGAAMTTVAYCAVSPDGRTFADQLYLRAEELPRLRTLTDAVHREGAAASLQLGHAGGFSSNRELRRRRPFGPSRGFNRYGALAGLPLIDPMSDDDIEQVTREFVEAARLAREAGFDAVELHLGHGYLLSQFLSPSTNRRRDAYGGALAQRARFPLAVVERVRAALSPSLAVLAKINLRDGHPGGLELDESVQVARWLEARGADALVLSGGFVSRDPFYLFRGEAPLAAMIAVEPRLPVKIALGLFGPWVVRAHPFEPMYFLPLARAVRRAVRMPLVLLGGITTLAHLQTARDEGFELAAMARALIHDPGLIAKFAAGSTLESGCVPCNRCVAEMEREGGVRCVRQPGTESSRPSRIRRK